MFLRALRHTCARHRQPSRDPGFHSRQPRAAAAVAGHSGPVVRAQGGLDRFILPLIVRAAAGAVFRGRFSPQPARSEFVHISCVVESRFPTSVEPSGPALPY